MHVIGFMYLQITNTVMTDDYCCGQKNALQQNWYVLIVDILIMMTVSCFEVKVGRWVSPQVGHLKVSTLLPMHFPSNCQIPFQTNAF